VANRNLWGLALDPEQERLWITERGSTCYDSYIRKMRYSGGGVKTVAFPVCNPHDFEYVNGRIVWGERVGIVSADSGGSSIDTLVVDAAVYGLAVDGTWGRIYWADYTTDDIRRVDLDGSNEMAVVGGLGEFQCLATDYSPAVVSAEPQPAWPIAYGLLQNYPNPFNPSTTITWDLPERVDVDLSVFNALGQRVATLVDAPMEAGRHSAEFHASGLAGGVYVYRLRAGAFTQSCRMVLIR
jgi:hypothetical protein